MFTRYTPGALECANIMRMYAMRTAAFALDLEHLASALLTVSPTLFGWLTDESGREIQYTLGPPWSRARAGTRTVASRSKPSTAA